ncbi:MAG TPA: response regulator [Tepidisphaeraceae bacterium]|jgi:two-component system chemotaxis response regulator CheY|nr:response regulator [Tepidisphaeraceae bacterium]
MTATPGHNILIVDDSSTTRAFIRRVIGLSGFQTKEIYEASDGKKALELLNQQAVDIVLADLQMPEMDGEEMSRRIFNDPTKQHVSVIVVSADPNEQKIQSLLQAGAKGYLAKPFTPEAFRKALLNVIGGVQHA